MRKHEIITGPACSGKSYTAAEWIRRDLADELETWVVDPYFDLAEVRDHVTRYAQTTEAVEKLLTALVDEAFKRCETLGVRGIREFESGDPAHGYRLIVATIENAADVLTSGITYHQVKDLVRMARRAGIRFRLVMDTAEGRTASEMFGDHATAAAFGDASMVVCRYGQPEREFVPMA